LLWFNILLDRTKQIVVNWIDVGRQYLYGNVNQTEIVTDGSGEEQDEQEENIEMDDANIGGQQHSANDRSR